MLWKYYKNIVNVTLFLKFLPRFWQQFFFFLPFRQWHCHNSIQVFSHFRQYHCHNYQKKFFFFFYFGNGITAIAFFFNRTGGNLGRGISITVLPKFLFFLSPPFCLSLSKFLLNFGNTVAEILSLSSIAQLTSNSTYKAN